MEERYFIKVGNCYAAFSGIKQETVIKSDYTKAAPFLTAEAAKKKANSQGLKNYKIVRKML